MSSDASIGNRSRIRGWRGRPTHLLLSLLGATAALLMTSSAASAHVSVLPAEVPPDSNQTFSVRVPNEKDDQGTVKVRLELPAGLIVSRFQPKPGWTREVEKNGQGLMTAVTWSGAVIGPAEFEDFVFQARTPKEGSSVSFKAYQTYQGGEIVEWVNAAGQDRAAPILALKAPGSAADGTDDRAQAAAGGQPAAKPAAGQPSSSAPVAGASTSGSDLSLLITLVTGLLAVIAIVISGIALSRRPRTA